MFANDHQIHHIKALPHFNCESWIPYIPILCMAFSARFSSLSFSSVSSPYKDVKELHLARLKYSNKNIILHMICNSQINELNSCCGVMFMYIIHLFTLASTDLPWHKWCIWAGITSILVMWLLLSHKTSRFTRSSRFAISLMWLSYRYNIWSWRQLCNPDISWKQMDKKTHLAAHKLAEGYSKCATA